MVFRRLWSSFSVALSWVSVLCYVLHVVAWPSALDRILRGVVCAMLIAVVVITVALLLSREGIVRWVFNNNLVVLLGLSVLLLIDMGDSREVEMMLKERNEAGQASFEKENDPEKRSKKMTEGVK